MLQSTRPFYSLAIAMCFVLVVVSGCSRNETVKKTQSINAVTRGSEELANSDKTQADTAQLLALAEASYNAKDWEAAEKNYVEITRAIPKEAHPWFRLGNIYARTERPEFAVRAYKEALLRDSNLSKAWYNMGLVQLRQSANSFLQMRTYTPENSSAQERAEAMYEAIIDVIKHGPQQATTFPLPTPGEVAPRRTELPLPAPQNEFNLGNDSENQDEVTQPQTSLGAESEGAEQPIEVGDKLVDDVEAPSPEGSP